MSQRLVNHRSYDGDSADGRPAPASGWRMRSFFLRDMNTLMGLLPSLEPD